MSTNFALTACPCAKVFRVNGDISLKSAKLTYLSTFLTSNGNTSETCGAPLYQWPDATNDSPTTKRGFRRPPPAHRRTSYARSPAFSDPAPTHMPRAQRTEVSHGGRPRDGAHTPLRNKSHRGVHTPIQRVDGPSRHPHPPTRKVHPRTASQWISTMKYGPCTPSAPLIPPSATRRTDSLIALIR